MKFSPQSHTQALCSKEALTIDWLSPSRNYRSTLMCIGICWIYREYTEIMTRWKYSIYIQQNTYKHRHENTYEHTLCLFVYTNYVVLLTLVFLTYHQGLKPLELCIQLQFLLLNKAGLGCLCFGPMFWASIIPDVGFALIPFSPQDFL